MADETKAKKVTKFYRSNHFGLTLYKEGDPTQSVRFQPFFEKFQGDDVRVGYLETDDAYFQGLLDADDHVTEIDEKEYRKSTEGDDVRPASYATA